jgi:hypothetical protein
LRRLDALPPLAHDRGIGTGEDHRGGELEMPQRRDFPVHSGVRSSTMRPALRRSLNKGSPCVGTMRRCNEIVMVARSKRLVCSYFPFSTASISTASIITSNDNTAP